MTPGRRTLSYQDFDAINADVERLLQGCSTVGTWSLGQICDHLATVTERALNLPPDGPHDTSLRVPDEKRAEVFATGRLPEGIPLPAALTPPTEVDAAQAAGRLRRALAAMGEATGPLAPHRLFGPLEMDQWRRLVCIHCAHHLSFAVPSGGEGDAS